VSGRWSKLDAGFIRHPKSRAAGRHGREVFVFALCINAESDYDGRIPAGYFGPNYLSRELDMTVEEAADAFDAAVAADLLAIDGLEVVIVGWDPIEWGSGKPSDRPEATRERKRQSRERLREATNTVTRDTDTKTACHAVTPEERRGEESIGERENQPFLAEGTKPDHRPGRKKPATPMPEGWVPDEGHRQLARENSVDLTAEVAKFRDWVAANDSRYVNWSAAFSGWLRRARSYGARPVVSATSVDDDDIPTLFENGRRTGT